MEKILDLLNLLNENDNVTKDDITDYFEFAPRQTDYYLNAAVFLGFATTVKRGRQLFPLPGQPGGGLPGLEPAGTLRQGGEVCQGLSAGA